MASVDRIDSIYNVAALTEEQKRVEDLVLKSVEQIKAARKESIELNLNTKTFADYEKKLKELEKSMLNMSKASTAASKASTEFAKSKEAEAKAALAVTKATTAETKEKERLAANTKKAAQAAKDAERPYKQLALAFKIAAERAQDLSVKYGQNSKQAQAAAREANNLNNQLKKIDASIGNHQRNVGNYSSALDGAGSKLKGLTGAILGLAGIAGLGSLFQSSIDEFIEMDKNVRILQNTLNNLNVPQAFDRISASADELAEKFGFIDNDDILKTFNSLLVYGKLSEDQINDLIPVIIDFATATGQDLAGATSTIIKALEGNGKALKEFGIDIKDAKNTTEAFGIIMTQLAPKVEGVASAFGDSAAGGLATAKQEFKNLKEELGEGLLPILNAVLGAVNKLFQGFVFLGKEAGNLASDIGDLFTGDLGVLLGEGEGQLKRMREQQEKIEKTAGSNIAKELLAAKSAGEAINELNFRVLNFQNLLAKAKANKSGVFDAKDVERYEKAIRVAKIALDQIFKAQNDQIKGTGADKLFGAEGKGTQKKTAIDTSAFDILKANIELDKEFDAKRLENDKLSYQERLAALTQYTLDSQRLIEVTAEHELSAADLTAGQRLKIENDKNNALIRLAQETADKLAKIVAPDLKTDTSKVAGVVKGISGQIQKALDDAKKESDKFIEDFEKNQERLKQAIKDTLVSLASELEGLLFDIFTNAIEREKNLVQDQIDLLEQQKQKDIEVANQTIANAQEKADAIAVIEARAAAKRQQLELRQRQLDQQKAKFEKARAVTDIVQGTAIAVIGALGAKPWTPANIALAAIVGALGAVQIARVLAQPIPRYAKGTEDHPGGPAIVGDGGRSEAVVLPDGTIYKTPATDTLVHLPRGAKVLPDYADLKRPIVVNDSVDTTLELRRGFGQVVGAIKKIPQPIIKSERAWTVAHKTGSSFRNYINRSI